MSTISSYSTYSASTYTGNSTAKGTNSQNTTDGKVASQDQYKDTYESSAQGQQKTGVRAVINSDGSLSDPNAPSKNQSNLSDEAKANLKTQMAGAGRVLKLGLEMGIDFSSTPTTAEGKKAYNEAVFKLYQDESLKGYATMPPFLGSLNKIEGTDWMISDGAEALIGHDVLSLFESDRAASDSFQNAYGAVNPRIDEYGYSVDLPGKYKDLSYLTGSITMPDGSTKKTPGLLGMDGGQTYAPEIHYEDALGLAGMSLADRKTFLSTAQSILDQVAPGLDVRQLKFSTGYLNEQDMKSNIKSLTIENASAMELKNQAAIEAALNTNRSLYEMKAAADASSNKTVGEYTMSVLDASGNALAKNQVRLIASGREVTTTVDTIKDMDHQQIYSFILGRS